MTETKLPPPLYGLPTTVSLPMYPWYITHAVTGLNLPTLEEPRPLSVFADISKKINLSESCNDLQEEHEMLTQLRALVTSLPENITPILDKAFDPIVDITSQVIYHMPMLPTILGLSGAKPKCDTTSYYSPLQGYQVQSIGGLASKYIPSDREGKKSQRLCYLDLRPHLDFLFEFNLSFSAPLSTIFDTTTYKWHLDTANWQLKGGDVKLLARRNSGEIVIPTLNNVHSDGRLCTGNMDPIISHINKNGRQIIPGLCSWMANFFAQKPNQDLNSDYTRELFSYLVASLDSPYVYIKNHQKVAQFIDRCLRGYPGLNPAPPLPPLPPLSSMIL